MTGGTLSDELKWGLLIVGAFTAIVIAIVVYHHKSLVIDSQAPIVETCVKHPATVSPFKPNY